MPKKNISAVLIIFSCFLFALPSLAQKPVNWTREQLMQPVHLADILKRNDAVPFIYSIGPGAVIQNSIDIGSVKEEDNMVKFKTHLSKLSKDANIVVYCGCCPFENCPNVRPAVATLKDMQFSNYKLLNLERNVKTDWLDKGYPSSQ
jgi:rhodanese-related sulfurtransferase